jgi:hypothetical protein
MRRYLALVHHPIINKRAETITTSVTNLDIHDIARTCKTFGFTYYFIVTPLEAQQELVERILSHWQTDGANDYNPDRSNALSLIKVVPSLESAEQFIRDFEGHNPLRVVTQAKASRETRSCLQLKDLSSESLRPILLVLGTGWGLHSSIVVNADVLLNPIPGVNEEGYNHLSVRSAAAIYASMIALGSLV